MGSGASSKYRQEVADASTEQLEEFLGRVPTKDRARLALALEGTNSMRVQQSTLHALVDLVDATGQTPDADEAQPPPLPGRWTDESLEKTLQENDPVECVNQDWHAQLRTALRSTKLVSAEWLADLADAGGILPRCQDVPREAQVTFEEIDYGWEFEGVSADGGTYIMHFGWLPVIVLSYPWLDADHPDCQGEQLRQLAFVFRIFSVLAKRMNPKYKVGVFWDYASMPQRSRKCPSGQDDRTEEDQAQFKQALRSINTWYADDKTLVLIVDTPLPRTEHTNMQPYEGRGWCQTEKAMSALVKLPWYFKNLYEDAKSYLDDLLSEEVKSIKLLRKFEIAAKRDNPPVAAPDRFRNKLTEAFENGDVKFTNKGDVDLVCDIYERAFLAEFAKYGSIGYENNLSWGPEAMTQLSEALVYAHSKGLLAKKDHWAHYMRSGPCIYLNSCPIGDKGLRTILEVLGSIQVPIDELFLHNCRIGDEGAKDLAAAIRSGSLLLVGPRQIGLSRNLCGEDVQQLVVESLSQKFGNDFRLS